MEAELERARLLSEAHRPQDAVRILQELLAAEPGNVEALIELAHCQCELKQLSKAWYAARDAVAAAPDDHRALSTLALVAFRRQSFDEAERALNRARELAPQQAGYFSFASILKYVKRRYHEALSLAEAGLKLDPQDDGCARARARALLRLDRADEARGYLQLLLAREPESSLSQAQLGWTALQQGDRKTAVLAFREALRMEPELEWARQGLLESLRMTIPFYRYILAFHLKLEALTAEERMILGVVEAYVARVITLVGCATVVLFPLSLAYLTVRSIFIYMMWAARPITGLFLCLHRWGRYCLDDDEKKEALWALPGALGVVATVSLAVMQRDAMWLLGSFVALYALSCVGAVFVVRPGWPRWTLAACAVGLLALGSFSVEHLLSHGTRDWPGWALLLLFVWLRQGMSWLTTLLAIFTRPDPPA
jgi:tetratricopeptide (TPR) repeat protein